MSKQDNILAQQQFGEAINSGNLECFKELISPDAVDHDPEPDQGGGRRSLYHFFENFRAAFPDLKADVMHMIADEEDVSIAYTVTGRTKEPSWVSVPQIKRERHAACRLRALKTAGLWSAGAVQAISAS